MTTPFQFPSIHQGNTIQDPGMASTIASSLAQVLAAQQQQKEEQYRQQVLQQKQLEAQQQAQYQQGMLGVEQGKLGVEQGKLAATNAETQAKIKGQQQVGGAMRQAYGGQPASPTEVPGQPNTQGAFSEIVQGGAQALAPAQGHPDIFGGVTDENMPAAVKGVQDVKDLQPKPQEPTGDIKNFEYMGRLAQKSPQLAKMFYDFINHPTTKITNIAGQGETEYAKKTAEARVGVLGEFKKAAATSLTGVSRIDQAYKLADTAITGVGAGARLDLARVLGSLGQKSSKDAATDTQVFKKLTGEGTLDYLRDRALGSGTAVSDSDREFMQGLSGSDTSLNAPAIKKILRINYGTGVMKIQDAINELRDQAVSYPENARDLNRQATELERKMAPIQARYFSMLQDEHTGVEDLRKRMKAAGLLP